MCRRIVVRTPRSIKQIRGALADFSRLSILALLALTRVHEPRDEASI